MLVVGVRSTSGNVRAMKPASRTAKDIASRPPAKLCVTSLIRPTIEGPTKPARLPVELIKAMPPAAAAPSRKAGGIDQKGPAVLDRPAAAIAIVTMASAGGCAAADAASAIPPANAA